MTISLSENEPVPVDKTRPATQMSSASDMVLCLADLKILEKRYPGVLHEVARGTSSRGQDVYSYENSLAEDSERGVALKVSGITKKRSIASHSLDGGLRQTRTAKPWVKKSPNKAERWLSISPKNVVQMQDGDRRASRARHSQTTGSDEKEPLEAGTQPYAPDHAVYRLSSSVGAHSRRTLTSFRRGATKPDVGSAVLDFYPEYSTTIRIDELRITEYSYLDKQDHVYLDYTGSGLAARAQYRAHKKRLARTLCSSPHSANPTSEAATQLIDEARARVLAHLNASPDEYAVIFTQNATGAAKLVGEAYPFCRRTKLIMSTDNHNSVTGLREYARRGHARIVTVAAEPPELRIDSAVLISELARRNAWEAVLGTSSCMDGRRGLFAYPAQSNFSGVRHPLSWVKLAQQHGYDVLLDAAAYLPTGTIDLSVVQPEFLLVSWYKLFGYPTGVGCLVARRSALARLSRPWFSGGTTKAVAVAIPWHEMAKDESAFEDGTLNFLSIPDVVFGLDWLAYIGMDVIETRVRCLTGWFLDRLKRLEHSDGSPMIRIYGPADMKGRGGTVAFNFLDIRGNVVDERLVAAESAAARISLRTGCFSNAGVAEKALGLTVRKLRPLYYTPTENLDELIKLIGLPSAGVIRISFGLASNAADVDRFFDFAATTYRDRVNTTAGLPPRERC